MSTHASKSMTRHPSELSSLAHGLSLGIGRVTKAMAHTGIYEVASVGQFPFKAMAASAMSGPGTARNGTELVPGTRVIYAHSPQLELSIILSALSDNTAQGLLDASSWLTQNSQIGLPDSAVHSSDFDSQDVARNRSNGTPRDALPGEDVQMNSNGVGTHRSATAFTARASALAGMHFDAVDNYTRLSGWNFDEITTVGQRQVRDDQGELLDNEVRSYYPWETMGAYTSGTITADKTTQTKRGPFWGANQKMGFEPVADDQVQVPRWRRLSGYVGLGELTTLSSPPPTATGVETMSSPAGHAGLAAQHFGLDGAYRLSAARGILLEKTLAIPVPSQAAIPEDPTADGPATYRASGTFGAAAAPTPNFGVFTDDVGFSSAFAAWDRQTWAATKWIYQPLLMHLQDWDVIQASASWLDDGRPVSAAQYAASGGAATLAPADSTSARVDPVCGIQKFYRSRAYIELADDGSIIAEDGHGSQFVLANGKLRITAPLDVEIIAGRDFRVLAGGDICMLGNKSVDISASQGDMRLKAQGQLQVVGVAGGVLIEDKSVKSVSGNAGGITLLSAGDMAIKAANVHTEASGDVTLQATGKLDQRGAVVTTQSTTGDLTMKSAAGGTLFATTTLQLQAAVSIINQSALVGVQCGALTIATGTVSFSVASASGGPGAVISGNSSGLYLGQTLQIHGDMQLDGGIFCTNFSSVGVAAVANLQAQAASITSLNAQSVTWVGSGSFTGSGASVAPTPPVVNPPGTTPITPPVPPVMPAPSPIGPAAAGAGFLFRDAGAYASPSPTVGTPFEAAAWQQRRRDFSPTTVKTWAEPPIPGNGSMPWPGAAAWPTKVMAFHKTKLSSPAAVGLNLSAATDYTPEQQVENFNSALVIDR